MILAHVPKPEWLDSDLSCIDLVDPLKNAELLEIIETSPTTEILGFPPRVFRMWTTRDGTWDAFTANGLIETLVVRDAIPFCGMTALIERAVWGNHEEAFEHICSSAEDKCLISTYQFVPRTITRWAKLIQALSKTHTCGYTPGVSGRFVEDEDVLDLCLSWGQEMKRFVLMPKNRKN